MIERDVDVLLLSVGADLPYFAGYEAMPLERLTMLVVPRDGLATLVIPRLEAPRVHERDDVFALRPWSETDDPIEVVAGLIGPARRVAIGDTTWARFLVDLMRRLPGVTWRTRVGDHLGAACGEEPTRDCPVAQGVGRR